MTIMKVLNKLWATPRLWRYVAVGTIAFTIGGSGTALAANNAPLLTQLVYNGVIAHIDGSGNLMVNDSAASTALNTGNDHLSSIDSKLSSGTVNVAGSVGINGRPTVMTGDATTVLFTGYFTPTANGITNLIGTEAAPFDTSAYREITIRFSWQFSPVNSNTFRVWTVTPSNGGDNGAAYQIDTQSVPNNGNNGHFDSFTYDLLPNIYVFLQDGAQPGIVQVELVGRAN